MKIDKITNFDLANLTRFGQDWKTGIDISNLLYIITGRKFNGYEKQILGLYSKVGHLIGFDNPFE